MKKVLLSICVVCGFSTVSLAQGFYLKLQGGYNFNGLQSNDRLTAPKVSGNATDLKSDGLVPMANINELDSTYAPVKGSYGKGANLSLGVGYMINNWFGVELGANYLWGGTTSSTVTTLITAGNVVPADKATATAKINTYTNGLSLSPSLVFVGAVPKWPVQPYAKIGLALPVYGKVVHTVDVTLPTYNPSLYNNSYLGKENHMELETEGTVSLGVNWSVGVRYTPKQLPFITVYAESSGQWLNVRGKSTKVTVYETSDANGVMVDRINNSDPSLNRSKYRTEFIYHDALDGSSNNGEFNRYYTNPSYDPDRPKDDIRPIAPFSNIGIQVGIQLNFSKEALSSLKKKKSATN